FRAWPGSPGKSGSHSPPTMTPPPPAPWGRVPRRPWIPVPPVTCPLKGLLAPRYAHFGVREGEPLGPTRVPLRKKWLTRLIIVYRRSVLRLCDNRL
ncbi:MAG: hypothetical protein F7B59_05355, partial [Desulfurococcales archaeon]|nr:hypothetical protein [Desulfurococcales archaeon]